MNNQQSGDSAQVLDVAGCIGSAAGEGGTTAKELAKVDEPPRAKNRSRQEWATCASCAGRFARPLRSPRVCCSRACSAARFVALGTFAGSGNPRWLGGVSNDNMRYRRRQVEREPLEEAARRAVHNAVRRGDLVRQPCETCGHERAEGHHDDYSRPLDVRWLCRAHHAAHHVAARRTR